MKKRRKSKHSKTNTPMKLIGASLITVFVCFALLVVGQQVSSHFQAKANGKKTIEAQFVSEAETVSATALNKKRSESLKAAEFGQPQEVPVFVGSWRDGSVPENDFAGVLDVEVLGNDFIALNKSFKRMQRYSFDGTFKGSWNYADPLKGIYRMTTDGSSVFFSNNLGSKIERYDLQGNFITEWGTEGSGSNQLNKPFGIFFDQQTSYLYIADSNNNRVQVFTKDGSFIRTIGTAGIGSGQLTAPMDVLVRDKKVYIVDYPTAEPTGRLQVFSVDGQYIKTIEQVAGTDLYLRKSDSALFLSNGGLYHMINRDDLYTQTFMKVGTEYDEIFAHSPLIFDGKNRAYVVDTEVHTVKIFASDVKPPVYNTPLELKIKQNGAELSLKEWYKNNMSSAVPETASYDWFTAWKTIGIQDTLYLLLGTGAPNDLNGAALASASLDVNGSLTPKLTLVQNRQNEKGQTLWYMEDDGVLDMDVFGGTNLLIPGVDPGYQDNWSGGNAYTYSSQTDTLKKIRCKTQSPQTGDCGANNHVFPNGVHAMASTVIQNSLYVGVSEIRSIDTAGAIYRSQDGGGNWQKIHSFPDDSYRVYDLNTLTVNSPSTSRGNQKVALFAVTYSGLHYSIGTTQDVGTVWQPYTGPGYDNIDKNVRSTSYGDKYYFVTGDGLQLGIISVNADNSLQTTMVPFRDFTVGYGGFGDRAYNVLTATNDSLYVISDGKYIYKGTLAGTNWQRVASISSQSAPMSLSYWTNKNKLVVVTKGESAQVLLINPTR